MQKFSVLKRFIITTALVGVAMAFAAPPADAAFVLRIDDDGVCTDTTVQVNCDVFVTDATGPPYSPLTFNGSIGNFLVNVATGVDLNPSNPAADAIDLNSVDVFTPGPPGPATDSLLLELSGTGFDDDNNPAGGILSWLWGGTVVGGNALAQGCKGTTNVLFACNVSSPVLGPSSGAFAHNGSVFHPGLTGPYSLTIRVLFNALGEADYSGNFRLQDASVPEPGSMILLGTGLMGLARTARRKLAKKRG